MAVISLASEQWMEATARGDGLRISGLGAP